MATTTPQISTLVRMESPRDVLEEARKVAAMTGTGCDEDALAATFSDMLHLFQGTYPGYLACDTYYHDLKHTTDTFLAMSRIIHGAVVEGLYFTRRQVTLGLISALMHDTGYIRRHGEEGPGARYTLTHIQRSIDFMEAYFASNGFSGDDFVSCRNILNCTGLNVAIDKIRFTSKENEIIGKMLGTADLLGQMADRTYLEKLPFLYDEFRIAGVPGVESEREFYRSTPGFFEMTKRRFQKELGGVNRYMRPHFRMRWGIDEDLYMSAIERSIAYLKEILAEHPGDCRNRLRRAGMMERLERIKRTASVL